MLNTKKRLLSLAAALLILLSFVQAASAAVQPLTEQNVYEAIISMKSQYPERMRWTNANTYDWPANRWRPANANPNTLYYFTGGGCVAFAMIMSDAAFGDLPVREHNDISQLRVGDMVRVNDGTYNEHSFIVLEVHPAHIIIAEGNYNSSVHWGRKITNDDLKKSLSYIWTRYPASGPEIAPDRVKANDFVVRLYELCLNRTPHPDEMKGWVDALVNGDITGTKAAEGFFFSPEMTVYRNLNNPDFMEILYNTLLGRPSDAPGKADWVSALNIGYSREEIFRLFAASQEFGTVCASYGIRR